MTKQKIKIMGLLISISIVLCSMTVLAESSNKQDEEDSPLYAVRSGNKNENAPEVSIEYIERTSGRIKYPTLENIEEKEKSLQELAEWVLSAVIGVESSKCWDCEEGDNGGTYWDSGCEGPTLSGPECY